MDNDLRKWMRLIEEADAGFLLPSSLPAANYKITNSLSDVKTWQAKIILGNSIREDMKIGDWDKIGYVMINIKNNQLIPIPHSDEHHMGFDLLHYFGKKFKINPQNYTPISAYSNFIYSQDGMEEMIIAAKKWLSYGGPDAIVRGGSHEFKMFGTLSDLVKHQMKMLSSPDRLAPTGERLLKAFEQAATINSNRLKRVKTGTDTSAVDRSFFRAGRAVLAVAIPIMEYLFVKEPNPETLMPKFLKLEANNDTDGLESLLFGLPSVKNAIHQTVRQTMNGTFFRSNNVTEMFGNLSLANDMLGRI